MTHLRTFRFSTIELSGRLIHPWSGVEGEGERVVGVFLYLSKDTGPGFSSISPEIMSRALSKGLTIAIDRYRDLKK